MLWCGGRDEEGFYYGVNLRGTNFLILCARLGGKNKPISDLYREEIPIPSNLMAATSKVSFLQQQLQLQGSFLLLGKI